EEIDCALDHVRLHFNACLLGEGHAPDNVSSHEMIAVALFPPAPTAVRVLEVVEAIETLFGHRVEFFQIVTTLRMRRGGARLFNAAEDLVHRRFGLEAEIAQRLGGD